MLLNNDGIKGLTALHNDRPLTLFYVSTAQDIILAQRQRINQNISDIIKHKLITSYIIYSRIKCAKSAVVLNCRLLRF